MAMTGAGLAIPISIHKNPQEMALLNLEKHTYIITLNWLIPCQTFKSSTIS